jgi:hypothetical protein
METTKTSDSGTGRFPIHGWAGLLLVSVCWLLNWLLPGLRTHFFFFPLWLGYVLAVDGLLCWRTRTSPLKRSPRVFVGMFVISAPVWWIFELLNLRINNWEYFGREHFTDLEFFLYGSLNFSTVIPAVLTTAEFYRSFKWIERLRNSFRIPATRRSFLLMFVVGLSMLGLFLSWPVYFFPFIWSAIFFMLEPINFATGKRTLLSKIAQGDWRTVIALFCGALTCGFFWEMWNYFSYPKWTYHIPFVDFWLIFEMPLLGYLGYLPFSLELFALVHFVLPKDPQVKI